MGRNHFEESPTPADQPMAGGDGSATGDTLPFQPMPDRISEPVPESPLDTKTDVPEELNKRDYPRQARRALQEMSRKVPNVPQASLQYLLPSYWEELSTHIDELAADLQEIITAPRKTRRTTDNDDAYDEADKILVEQNEDELLDYWKWSTPDNLKPLLIDKLAKDPTPAKKDALALLRKYNYIE